MAEDNSHPAHLEPSELGTKDYWETFYARTLTHISSKHNASATNTKPTHTKNHNDDNDDQENDHAYDDSDADDDDDPGTSWFSEHNAPEKVLDFLTSEEFPLAPENTSPASGSSSSSLQQQQQQPSILDLGTGNGSMLALLRKRGGFRGDMVGVDYSARSVELARELQRMRIHSAYLSESESDDDGYDHSGDEGEESSSPPSAKKEKAEKGKDTNIRFEEWDILHSTDALSDAPTGNLDWFPYEKGGFDIVLDKGTFDAVSLSDETVPGDGGAAKKTVQRRVCETYPGVVRRLVRKGGFVVVTSCNWTEEELIAWFTRGGEGDSTGSSGSQDGLEVWGRVEYPRFRFGGMEGQGVCTVCFQRV